MVFPLAIGRKKQPSSYIDARARRVVDFVLRNKQVTFSSEQRTSVRGGYRTMKTNLLAAR